RLTVTPDGIEIAARTNAGAFYGVQTLQELIVMHGEALPCCRINDAPDFARRGVYYDCARGKVPTVETLKALVVRLARWKINELQLYIKNTFTWQAHPKVSRGFSPFTPGDILELQAHCKQYHVRLVPSLATLSHNELALQLPEYRHLAELPGFNGWEGGTMLCPTDPKSIRFVEELYREFVPLFEAEDFNVCCDEPWELGKGRSKRVADRRGSGLVYFDFLRKVHNLCERHGKRMNAWGDIVLKYPELIEGLPSDIVMLNWDYDAAAKRMARTPEFVRAGQPVMVCPGTSSWQRHGTDLRNAMQNVARSSAIGRRCKVDGLLNTDWGDFGHRNPLGVSLHGYAHGAAHSWCGAKVDEDAFTDAFALHVFMDSGALSGAIRTLGCASSDTLGHSICLYHALVEPLQPPLPRFLGRFRRVPIVSHYPAHFPNCIDRPSRDALKRVIESLSVAGLWPEPSRKLERFDQQALADYRLATEMEVVAAERALLGQRIRTGETVGRRELVPWANRMHRLARSFETLWLTRNRHSRLADNLKLMSFAEAEARELAGR
ncbi:MAG: family 20 glycosylhydrolase, partial [Lentisphaerae bacterium]|nr:family 20 glycosylhydrolase [Lentisphaerota bacterium]